MIGPFPRWKLALILAGVAAVGLFLSLTSIGVPSTLIGVPSTTSNRYVTDPSAEGPLVGSDRKSTRLNSSH